MINSGVMALLAGLCAQILKVVLELVLHRRWRPSLILDNGGMPSSHTATVAALAMDVTAREGWQDPVTSLVLVFAAYVVSEATGLRQEMGRQATVLNEFMDRLRHGESVGHGRLRELVGHTWGEVAGGFVTGVVFVFAWWHLAPGP